MSTSFAIIGTGALGGLYGGLLSKAGNDVHFLVRSDFDTIQSDGLEIRSPICNFRLQHPQIYRDSSQMPKVDIAIVAWKTISNDGLASVLGDLCHDGTVVLVLQNGLDSEAAAAEVVGADRVLGGCCFLCSNKIAPGVIHHLDYGMITFGEYAKEKVGAPTERMQEMLAIFHHAQIEMVAVENLRKARWKKLAWNIPFNGLNVVLDANTDKIMQDPGTRRLAEDLMWEVRNAAAADGAAFEKDHVPKLLAATAKMVPYASSMYLDYQERRPLEVEAIVGEPLRSAQRNGYEPPKTSMLYQQLKFLDESRRSTPKPSTH
ncbi:MAG: putative 2-dehydropantoate 2-reductase [Planctomycetota bacterium]